MEVKYIFFDTEIFKAEITKSLDEQLKGCDKTLPKITFKQWEYSMKYLNENFDIAIKMKIKNEYGPGWYHLVDKEGEPIEDYPFHIE